MDACSTLLSCFGRLRCRMKRLTHLVTVIARVPLGVVVERAPPSPHPRRYEARSQQDSARAVCLRCARPRFGRGWLGCTSNLRNLEVWKVWDRSVMRLFATSKPRHRQRANVQQSHITVLGRHGDRASRPWFGLEFALPPPRSTPESSRWTARQLERWGDVATTGLE